ncbi:MAG: hypothetical protein N3F07_04110 [Candidatus Micrarchaeota archaeon]|nr:hypothetical protein [Candidatus Micrarchaeota archaeon]
MGKTGQAASEFAVILAASLLVALVALGTIVIWPSYSYSVEKQRSDDYWAAAQPFSVEQHGLYPDRMLLQLRNTEPVSLSIRGIYLDYQPRAFRNHSVPFSWAAYSEACSGGNCNLPFKPGQRQALSVPIIGSPCSQDASAKYKMMLTISYSGSNGTVYNQTSIFPLVGSCGT